MSAVAAAALGIAGAQNQPLRSAARRAWKDRAAVTIQHRFDAKAGLEREIARLKPHAAARSDQGGWVGDDLLVAKNGEWIICRNVCAKEQNAAVKRDVFIGRGSDGRWYYSTFHFCVALCVLRAERQPDTLAQFVDAYWLVPFDGKSDDALKVTWDGGPYGDEKLQSASAVRLPQ